MHSQKVSENPLFYFTEDDVEETQVGNSFKNFAGRSYAPGAPKVQGALEHRQGSDTLQERLWEENRVVTRVGPILFMLCGFTSLAMFAVTFLLHFGPQAELVEFGLVFLEGVDEIYTHAWRFVSWGPLVAGIVMLCSSIVGYFALSAEYEDTSMLSDERQRERDSDLGNVFRQTKSRTLIFQVSVSLAFITAIATIVFGGIYLGFLFTLDEIASLNQKDSNASTDEVKQRFLDYQVSIFNGCCAAQGWTRQGEVELCQEDLTCTVPAEFEPYHDSLCTCYSDKEIYDQDVQYVKETDMCTSLSKAQTWLSNADSIPGTAIPAVALLPDLSKPIPVVGKPEEFGCGLGFAKGFQWILFKWLSNTSSPIAIAVVATGVVQFVFLLLLFFQRCTEAEEKYVEQMLIEEVTEQVMKAQKNNTYTPRTQRRLRHLINMPSPVMSLGGSKKRTRTVSDVELKLDEGHPHVQELERVV